MKFYHGGVKNLKIGDFILPSSATGKNSCRKYYSDEQIRNGYGLADNVYVTTDLVAAKTYASVLPFGDLYVVEPVGEIGVDIDAPGISFICAKAKVVSVVQRQVKFKRNRLEYMLKG